MTFLPPSASEIDRTVAVAVEATRIDNTCYETYGDGWWDQSGPASGLHEMNPVRCDYADRVFQSCIDAEVRQSGRFIDIGCGGGILTEALARRGYRMTGFDISESSLAAARRHAAEAKVDVEYRTGSAYELDLPDGSVDGVVISDVLEHLHDLPRAASEISRVLKPGGPMMFDTINRTRKSWFLMILLVQRFVKLVDPDLHDWKLFITPEELTTVFGRSNLEIRELKGLGPAGKPLEVLRSVLSRRSMGPFKVTDDLSVSYLGYAVRR